MAKKLKRLISAMLATILCVSSLSLTAFAGEKFPINKTANGLDAKDQTDVTLTVPGNQTEVVSDIVIVLGHSPSANIPYMTDLLHKVSTASDGTNAKLKLGIVGYADTTEDEICLPLTEMNDVVPNNTMAQYRIEGRYNDGKVYTESAEDYKARKANAFAAWEAENPLLLQDMDYIIAKALEKTEDVYNGVNLESSLITARDMLMADEDVPADRKHMVVISTGLTYFFDTEDGSPAVVPVEHNGYLFYNDRTWRYFRNANNNTYPVPQWYNDEMGKDDWSAYWTDIVKWIEADQNDYVYTLGETYGNFVNRNNIPGGGVNSKGKYIYQYAGNSILSPGADAIMPTNTIKLSSGGINCTTEGSASAHAFGYDRAQYEAWKVFAQMSTPIGEKVETVLKDDQGNYITYDGLGYNCYSVYAALNYYSTNGFDNTKVDTNVTSWNSGDQYIGHSFMNYLAGGVAPTYNSGSTDWFDAIENKVLYTCAAGSTVVDYIGKNENGNFEFIENVDYIKLNVGGVDYTTAVAEAAKHIDKNGEAAKSSYAFTAPNATEPTFWLDYFYGDGETTERFVWTFGESVSLERLASLTYKLQLTEKKEDAGKYTVPTNISATLYPVDSDGKNGTPQLFPVPTVEYEVVPYDVDIVLALGAGIAKYDADYVSSNGEKYSNTYDSIVSLVEPLVNQGINVKLGLVAVEHYDDVAMPLTVLTKDNYKTVITEGLNTIQSMPAGPTNLHGNIVAAKAMLDADTSVPAENKFFHVIATGRTYNYDNAAGVPTTIINKVDLKGNTYYYWGHYLWQSQRGRHTSLYMIPDKYNNDFGAYWADVEKWVAADGDTYAYSFTNAYNVNDPQWFNTFFAANTTDAKAMKLASSRFGWILTGLTNSGLAAIGSGASPENALNYERAQYEAYQVYQDMILAGYNCYALCSESTSYQNGSPYIQVAKYTGTSTIQLGHSFMNFLAARGGQTEAPLLFVMTDPNTGASEMAKNFFAPIDIEKLVKSTEITENTVVKLPMLSTGPSTPVEDEVGENVEETLEETEEQTVELAILTQPTDAEAALGETVSTTVTAQGEGLKYQWYFRNAGAEKFSKSSIKEATYSTEMNKTRAGREIYCVITDAQGNKVTTDTVKLIRVAKEELAIITQPTNAEAALGETVSTTVKAQGEGLKYRWYFRNAGAANFSASSITTDTYSTTMDKTRAGREIYCVITDAMGNKVTTDTVKLIRVAKEELAIITQPEDVIGAKGETVSTTVIAQGEGLKYQWYIRNAGSKSFSKSSIKEATYSTEMNKTRANREIYCVITDALGNKVTTDTVTLICK